MYGTPDAARRSTATLWASRLFLTCQSFRVRCSCARPGRATTTTSACSESGSRPARRRPDAVRSGSTTQALYGRDPDGLEFEVSWLVPADRIDDEMLQARSRIAPLDLDREISRFGADTPGGIGVSRVAAVTA